MASAAEWRPIVVGVDHSRESAAAAALGSLLAQQAGTSCHLIHAVQDAGAAFAAMMMQARTGELEAALRDLLFPRLRAELRERVPPQVLDTLTARIGRPARVLEQEVQRVAAGLVVLCAKHRLALGRWLGGNTLRDTARISTVPVLVSKNASTPLRRVLAAVDLSQAAEPTIKEGERFASLAGGELRVIHVLEPVTLMPEIAHFVDQRRFDADSAAVLERDVWPLLRTSGAQRALRSGDAAGALASEATEWRADLLVVGSHGKGRLERRLLGTVTERLLNHLPTSLLIVPVHALEDAYASAPAAASFA